MPNWCFNRLIVGGKKADIEDFLEKVSDLEVQLPLSFGKIVPISAEANENWASRQAVDESIAKWGCQTDTKEIEMIVRHLDGDRSEVYFTFDTAWRPPGLVYRAMAEKFPGIDFRAAWIEAGNVIIGGLSSTPDGNGGNSVVAVDYDAVPSEFKDDGAVMHGDFALKILNDLAPAGREIEAWPEDEAPADDYVPTGIRPAM